MASQVSTCFLLTGRLLGLETCEAEARALGARGARLPGARLPGAPVPGAQVPGALVPGALVPGALVPGAVVLVLPAPPGAQRQCQPLVVAALLDGEGLALLASDDLLSRFAQLCPPPRP